MIAADSWRPGLGPTPPSSDSQLTLGRVPTQAPQKQLGRGRVAVHLLLLGPGALWRAHVGS